MTVSAVAMMVDYDVRQLSSRVVSALFVALCDMEFKAVKVAEWSGPNRSSTAKGSLYTWSHIHLQDVRGRGMQGRALHDERGLCPVHWPFHQGRLLQGI